MSDPLDQLQQTQAWESLLRSMYHWPVEHQIAGAYGMKQAARLAIKHMQQQHEPDISPGDVIHAEPDGTIVLDDGITTWNPARACEYLIRQERRKAQQQHEAYQERLQSSEAVAAAALALRGTDPLASLIRDHARLTSPAEAAIRAAVQHANQEPA